MLHPISISRPSMRWAFLAAVSVFASPMMLSPLEAQTSGGELNSLGNEIAQASDDLRALQLAANDPRPKASGYTGSTQKVSPETVDRLQTRVDDMENGLRQLTNQVEELGNRLNQISQQFQAYQAATDARLAAIQGAPQPQGNAPSNPSAPGTPVSGNSADNGGGNLAPGPTSLGKIPAGSAPASQGTPQDQYNAALGFLRSQDYPRAEASLRRFIAEHGETDLAGPAMYWLGEAYYAQGKYADAAQTFLDALKKYPQSAKSADSMLKLGMSLSALKQTKEACLAFKDLPRKYPNASQTIQQRAKVESERAHCK